MVLSKTIRAIDMRLIEDLFGMGGGYVLDFTDRTFAEFFADEMSININDTCYSAEGGSKAKRLRFFLRNSDPEMRVRAVSALWEYREASRRRDRQSEEISDAEAQFRGLIDRLRGNAPSPRDLSHPSVTATIQTSVLNALKNKLLEMDSLEPQARGFAYERFLRDLFDANGLSAGCSFRLRGEQVDGSFVLSGATYLLEAKWQGPPVGAADLRSFNGKVEDKAAWSRGLFVSHSGFTPDGLIAFGRGKRVVCMDGLDLYEMLNRGLSFSDVLARKVRRVAERGTPFVSVRDLYA